MYILVSDHTYSEHGEGQTSILCEACLKRALRDVPLGAGEYVLDADVDLDCDNCG